MWVTRWRSWLSRACRHPGDQVVQIDPFAAPRRSSRCQPDGWPTMATGPATRGRGRRPIVAEHGRRGDLLPAAAPPVAVGDEVVAPGATGEPSAAAVADRTARCWRRSALRLVRPRSSGRPSRAVTSSWAGEPHSIRSTVPAGIGRPSSVTQPAGRRAYDSWCTDPRGAIGVGPARHHQQGRRRTRTAPRRGPGRRRSYVSAGTETPRPPTVSGPNRSISAGRSSARRSLRRARISGVSRSAGTSQLTSSSMPSGSLA
jgi:hypothetical protein